MRLIRNNWTPNRNVGGPIRFGKCGRRRKLHLLWNYRVSPPPLRCQTYGICKLFSTTRYGIDLGKVKHMKLVQNMKILLLETKSFNFTNKPSRYFLNHMIRLLDFVTLWRLTSDENHSYHELKGQTYNILYAVFWAP